MYLLPLLVLLLMMLLQHDSRRFSLLHFILKLREWKKRNYYLHVNLMQFYFANSLTFKHIFRFSNLVSLEMHKPRDICKKAKCTKNDSNRMFLCRQKISVDSEGRRMKFFRLQTTSAKAYTLDYQD